MINNPILEWKNLNHLSTNTRQVLERLVTKADFLQDFVMVGGSALSLRLGHRLSEDLDFFTYDKAVEPDIILSVLPQFTNNEIINQTHDQIDLLLDHVKVTFFNSCWPFLKPQQPQVCNVASLKVVAALKAHVLFLRAKYRDYYDLYILSQHLGLAAIFDYAKAFIPGINTKLLSMALIYTDDIEDESISHLKPVEEVSKEQMRQYFERELERMFQDN